jgi:hypothetical protein
MDEYTKFSFPFVHLLLLQRSLVVKLAVADLARSLGHIRFHPGIVQEATRLQC